MTHTTCSSRTLAKLFDITERWVQQLAQEGILVRGTKRGEYELIGSVRGYVKHLQSRIAQRLEDVPGLHAERKRLLGLQADKTECELAIIRKEWISEADMNEFVNGLVDRFLQGLGSLPGRLAVDLMNQANPAVIRQKVKGECDAIKTHLLKQLGTWRDHYETTTATKRPSSNDEALQSALFEDAEYLGE